MSWIRQFVVDLWCWQYFKICLWNFCTSVCCYLYANSELILNSFFFVSYVFKAIFAIVALTWWWCKVVSHSDVKGPFLQFWAFESCETNMVKTMIISPKQWSSIALGACPLTDNLKLWWPKTACGRILQTDQSKHVKWSQIHWCNVLYVPLLI